MRNRFLAWSLCSIACGGPEKATDSGGPPLVDPELLPFILPSGDRPAHRPTRRTAGLRRGRRRFGRYLYRHAPVKHRTVSCATRHDPALGTGDGRPLSEAIGITARHAPALWNLSHQRWLYWDGRCDSLWCQATGPIEAEQERDGPGRPHPYFGRQSLREAYEALLAAARRVRPARFPRPHARSRRFSTPARRRVADHDARRPEHVTEVLVTVAKAIAAYERTLETGETPVDRFVHVRRRPPVGCAVGTHRHGTSRSRTVRRRRRVRVLPFWLDALQQGVPQRRAPGRGHRPARYGPV